MGRAGAARRHRRRAQHDWPGRPRRGQALSADDARRRAETLACWRGPVEAVPLGGGLTNRNFLVVDRGDRFVVRVGEDLPVHRVARADELAAQRAAFRVGLAPEIVHAETGAMVMRHVDGRTLAAADLREGAMLARVAALLRRCHAKVAGRLERPPARFWPFDVFRHYDGLVRRAGGRDGGALDDLAALAGRLEVIVGPPAGLAFCHNDLLPANLIDDGTRLWLLDWEYAGLNLPLFDLANLATNAEFDEAAERGLLATYFGGAATIPARRAWEAMRCVSLLREVLWSMAAEASSTLEVDYRAYTAENLRRLAAARQRLGH